MVSGGKKWWCRVKTHKASLKTFGENNYITGKNADYEVNKEKSQQQIVPANGKLKLIK